MRFVDVCGPPGSGKSTLCDDLWPPHAVKWDGYGIPEEWDDVLSVVDELLVELADHPSYRALMGMTRRSFRKMATVYRREDQAIYIQTGLAQRGLGFGWRLEERGKVKEVRRYFRVMPVSLGVAIASCPVEVCQERNRLREAVQETAHENRSHMVPLMQPAIAILKEEMDARSVPCLEIDTNQSIERARDQLVAFAGDQVADPKAFGYYRQMAVVPRSEQPGSAAALPMAHRYSA